jgi:hypothetical protein
VHSFWKNSSVPIPLSEFRQGNEDGIDKVPQFALLVKYGKDSHIKQRSNNGSTAISKTVENFASALGFEP